MIRKIVLSNFMAHARTELILSEGVNVIVGPNNVGKSSIAVALKILARNSNSQFVMKHEQKECSIQIETSEGHVIQWIKRKSPSYVINGQIKDRLGRGGTPPELDDTLRLAPIEFEDKDFEPHFGDQKSPIFLINRPPSQIAQFFSTTSDAERLVAMQRLHHKNRAQAQSQSKTLCDRNASLQLALDTLVEIPQIQVELDSLQSSHDALETTFRLQGNLDAFIHQFTSIAIELKTEDQRNSVLKPLTTVPALHPTEYLASVVERVERLHADQNYSMSSMQSLSSLQCVPAMEPTDRLERLLESLEHSEREWRIASTILDASRELRDPPAQLPTVELQQVIESLNTITLDDSRTEAQVQALVNLGPIPQWQDLSKLLQIIAEFTESESYLADNRLQMDQVQSALDELNLEISIWLQTDPKCTQCGALLTQESIRMTHHSHRLPVPPHELPNEYSSTKRPVKKKGPKLP